MGVSLEDPVQRQAMGLQVRQHRRQGGQRSTASRQIKTQHWIDHGGMPPVFVPDDVGEGGGVGIEERGHLGLREGVVHEHAKYFIDKHIVCQHNQFHESN
jgi:hypothetical protein